MEAPEQKEQAPLTTLRCRYADCRYQVATEEERVTCPMCRKDLGLPPVEDEPASVEAALDPHAGLFAERLAQCAFEARHGRMFKAGAAFGQAQGHVARIRSVEQQDRALRLQTAMWLVLAERKGSPVAP